MAALHAFWLERSRREKFAGQCGFRGLGQLDDALLLGRRHGTTINAAGSGIYAQKTSASSPADATTQGTYNVTIGDNATAGLGINSGCIQVDATMDYTLALRIAASTPASSFRPGFRFYSDPNCTEANRITSARHERARARLPRNYAGQSHTMGTRPELAITNASLTYNNGITCNCNVTGADWNVGTASTWTPTRNFAITFRVPDAYSELDHRGAVHARLHPGKYGGESEQDLTSMTRS